jgi:hypothetical protein
VAKAAGMRWPFPATLLAFSVQCWRIEEEKGDVLVPVLFGALHPSNMTLSHGGWSTEFVTEPKRRPDRYPKSSHPDKSRLQLNKKSNEASYGSARDVEGISRRCIHSSVEFERSKTT